MINIKSKIQNTIRYYLSIYKWQKRNFLGRTPKSVKFLLFEEYGIKNANFIETGTYRGETTRYLSANYPHVYSVEPSKKHFEKNELFFKNKNVTLINDISENALPMLLPNLRGDINFWLDGHYSGEDTFKGSSNCPLEKELDVIKKNILNFKNMTIFIDDVRCFFSDDEEYKDYPSIEYIIDWSKKMNLNFTIIHDVFIMQKKHTV